LKQLNRSAANLPNVDKELDVEMAKSKLDYIGIAGSLSDDEKSLLTFYRVFYPKHPTYVAACELSLKNAAMSLAKKGLIVEIPFSTHMYITQRGLVVSYIAGHQFSSKGK